MIVTRTEQHQIKKSHPRYNYCDHMSFYSENLYNIGNYYSRQVFTGLSQEFNKRQKSQLEVIEEVTHKRRWT
ncbi:hypothetical protein IZY60_11230 [Lutibacter sp. B2]|nr:hypothetical protein [Lutibacter sp. B2]